MMKVLIFTISFISIVSANATAITYDLSGEDTTVIVKKPATVTIEKTENRLSVEIIGNEENDDFYYNTTSEAISDNQIITTERITDWDFNIPFRNSKSDKKKYKDCITMGGFGFGMVNAMNAPDGMNVNMGASYELVIDHLIGMKFYPWQTGTAFSIGFGMTWRNYRMKGKTRFLKEDGNLILSEYPEGADIKFSRIKVFSLTVPLMVNQNLSRNIELSVGPVVNFNTHASLKTVYKMDGKTEKATDNNIHQNPVTIDLMANIQFKEIGLYFKYSPTNVLNTEFGPKFTSMSAGLTFFY